MGCSLKTFVDVLIAIKKKKKKLVFYRFLNKADWVLFSWSICGCMCVFVCVFWCLTHLGCFFHLIGIKINGRAAAVAVAVIATTAIFCCRWCCRPFFSFIIIGNRTIPIRFETSNDICFGNFLLIILTVWWISILTEKTNHLLIVCALQLSLFRRGFFCNKDFGVVHKLLLFFLMS